MGCNVSRLDGGGTTTLPASLRPLFLQQFEEIKARRHGGSHALKDSTPSKKELLPKSDHEEENACSSNPSKIMVGSIEDIIQKPEEIIKEGAHDRNEIGIATTIGNNDGHMTHNDVKDESSRERDKNDTKEDVKAKIEDAFTDVDEDVDDDDEHDHEDVDERMIGYEDDEAFPGSPSFRVYFKDNGEDCHKNDLGKKDVFKETRSSDDNMPPKEPSVEKKVKRGRKKRSFRKVLPKGGQAAVRNLLNVRSCYTPSHSSHDHDNLLTEKPTT